MARTFLNLKIFQARWWRIAVAVMWLVGFFKLAIPAEGQDNGFTEYHVKALFLYNFAKYVQWPDGVFPNSNAPITIGIVGDDNFGKDLPNAVEGKTVNGRGFVIKHLSATDDPAGCQILFISRSESSHVGQILANLAAQPVLTVGEDKAFSQNGGTINFVLMDGNVRLEINMDSADKAGLKISSRLLAVADTVKRKAGRP
jgi:hypothetical protein